MKLNLNINIAKMKVELLTNKALQARVFMFIAQQGFSERNP